MRTTKRKLTDDPVVLRLVKEINLQGKTEKEVEEAIGLTTGAFTRWKYEESKTYMKYIGRIADYLNLTTEYLLDIDEKEVSESSLSNDEIQLIKIYRKMDIERRNCLLSTAKYFIGSNGEK